MYKLINQSAYILRKADGTVIPDDPVNTDYQDYLSWVKKGNSPEPADPLQKIYPQFRGNEKLDLFTPFEQLSIVTATMSDPLVKLIYDRMIGAAYLSYEDPETEAGLALLVGKGLLTPERKTEIVSLMQAS